MKNKKSTILTPSLIFLLISSLIILLSTNVILSINQSNKTNSNNQVVAKNQNTNPNKLNKKTHKEVSLDNFLFLGDSYTFLLQSTINKHVPSALVLGESGVQPEYWIENFNTLPENSKVKGVVLLIGVNGVTFDDNLPDKEKLIKSLSEKYEDKTIYVEKVFPVGKNFTNADCDTFNQAIKSHNEEIESYCKKYSNVVFIDTTKGLVTRKGYLKYTEDGLHIKPSKQESFFKNIKNAINNAN